MATVLIVEDEKDLLSLLDYNLRRAELETVLASTAEEALAEIHRRVPDIVLLDLVLPDMPGTAICSYLKSSDRTRHVPVVMLTAKTEEIDRVVGFELGADDYVTKPFSMHELVLRLQVILRRANGSCRLSASERIGAIRLDLEAHRAFVADEEVPLTPVEFKLLATLIARAGRVLSREQVLSDVWGTSSGIEARTVDSRIRRLREKLGQARSLLETVRGVGYRLTVPRSPSVLSSEPEPRSSGLGGG